MTLRTGWGRLWLIVAVLLLLIGLASIVWVLNAAPPETDDRAFRATMAGWGVGVGALFLAVVALVLALRSGRDIPSDPPLHPPGSPVTQVIDRGSTGTIGGTHMWGTSDPPKGL